MNLNEYYNYLLDTNIAEEQTLQVVTDINGYSIDTLDDVLYVLTGYRNIAQYLEYEDTETYKEYYSKDEEDEE